MTKNILLGTILDNQYKIEALLGQGGMGDVYRARHITLGDLVAIKVMIPDKIASIEDKKRFVREGQAARKFKHTNAITVHDLRETSDGIAYMVMEYVEGHNLREEIKQKKQFSVKETLEIIEPIANALGEAHIGGVVHRDIKPENIMISRIGDKVTVKLLDLGIAKLIDEKTILTMEGQQLGTPFYMSPEQWGMVSNADPNKILEVDGRSDIYSLAIIMYEMLTGQRPFTGKTFQELAIQHITATPIPIEKLNPTVPTKFSQAVGQAMAKEPKDRFANCQEFIKGLNEGLILAEANLLATEKNIPNNLDSDQANNNIINSDSSVSSNNSNSELGENYNTQNLNIEVKNTKDKYLIIGLGVVGLLILLGLGLYSWHNSPKKTGNSSSSLVTPTPNVSSTPVVSPVENTEIISYWAKVVTKNEEILRKADEIVLSNDEKIQLYITSRQIGYLYLIVTGENNNLTTLLTNKPIVQTGVDSNLVSENEELRFPNGEQLIKMRGNSSSDKIIVIFSPMPIKTIPFLDKKAGYTLTQQEQELMDDLRAKSVSNKLKVRKENGTEMVVNTNKKLNDDEHLIFDIDIVHK